MTNDRPTDWNQRSRKVKQRDDRRCTNCGASGPGVTLNAHHNVPLKDGGSNRLSNLTTLCSDCHDAIHHNNKTAPTGQSGSDSSTDNNAGSALGAFFMMGVVFPFIFCFFFSGFLVGGSLSSIVSGAVVLQLLFYAIIGVFYYAKSATEPSDSSEDRPSQSLANQGSGKSTAEAIGDARTADMNIPDSKLADDDKKE